MITTTTHARRHNAKAELERLRAELAEALKAAARERAEAIDLLCDCAGQFLMSDDTGLVYHSFMSTEEALCRYLVRVGRLIPAKPGEFRWAESGQAL